MPDDPDIEEMDPIMKMYLFQHWIEDQNENVEFYKHHGYLIGSFINPEAVRKLTNANIVSGSDEDFEEATRIVEEAGKKQVIKRKKKSKKRKRV